VELIRHYAHTKTVESQGDTKLQVLNLGIGGNTSTKILERMASEIRSRHSASWPFLLIFSFGTNDARTADGEAETSVEVFDENVKSIIREARKYTDKMLFVGAPPIGQPVVHLKDHEYSDERLRAYESRLSSILQRENVPYVSLRMPFEDRA
jgi:lysophospholipase L1-like esterase